jgi:hypothetical protein
VKPRKNSKTPRDFPLGIRGPSGETVRHFPEFPEILEFVSGKHPKLREFHPYTLLQLETRKTPDLRISWSSPGHFRDFRILGHFWDFRKTVPTFSGISVFWISGIENRRGIFLLHKYINEKTFAFILPHNTHIQL